MEPRFWAWAISAPSASKPVMEGKGILFKKFADIDVFDIELNAKNPDDVIRACEMLEPTFGGINLEDIKAPECFYIEEELKKRLKIPVFHDDQHGTAVISGAAFLNALEIVGKKIKNVRVVFCGGGAAAIACANLYLNLGVRRENIIMADSKGVIYKGRKEGMNPYKERYRRRDRQAHDRSGARRRGCVRRVSVKDGISAEMVKKMAKDPIVFAMANPDPEVLPEEVLKVRPDAIMATGRSDYPNQVNNVLGFPFIFRGALDTGSTAINEEMKMAAVNALAQLAKEDVPESVSRAYGGQKFKFGRDYLIPKPFDRRALLWVAPAVAEAAIDSGVARKKFDIASIAISLETLLGTTYTVMRGIKKRVQARAEGERHSMADDRSSRRRKLRRFFAPLRSCAKKESPSRFCSETIELISAKIRELGWKKLSRACRSFGLRRAICATSMRRSSSKNANAKA